MEKQKRTLARSVFLKGAFLKEGRDTPLRSSPPVDVSGPVPKHLVKLPGGDWHLWQWAALRGAGLPATEVLKLSASSCVTDAENLLFAVDKVRVAHREALNAVRNALDALRKEGQWDDVTKREPLVKAMRQLSKGNVPSGFDEPVEVRTIIGAFDQALQAERIASINYREKFEATTIESSSAICDIAATERFQEAVVWQNRQAFHSAIQPLLRRPPKTPARSSKQRQHEELVAGYLQRYCVKNDTIGFFGPVGWARLGGTTERARIHPGVDLLASRRVYFEVWCMDELGAKLSEDNELRAWIAPRRLPYVYVEETTLRLPRARPQKISEVSVAALRACDGETTARDIVTGLRHRFPGQIGHAASGYELLKQLCDRGLISWKLELPIEPFPERTLRDLIGRVRDESLRQVALAAIDELEEKRAGVTRAAGNATELDVALAELEKSFSRLTGSSATRAHGKNYAARTLVYEDGRRDIEVEFGEEILQALGPPLTLLLLSARWYTHQVAEYYRLKFKEIYDELKTQTGSPTIDAAVFWYRLHALLYDSTQSAWNNVLPQFQQRWAKIFALPAGERRVSYSAETLRPQVEAAFAAPHPGWATARHHSPDVMIAAAGPEALRRGDYNIVMGELHLGGNTLRGSLFVNQHPRPQELHEAFRSDIAKQDITIVPPKSWPGLTVRTLPVLLTEGNHQLLVTHDAFGNSMQHSLPIASLVVEDSPDGLVFRTRDRKHSFLVHDNLSDVLSGQTLNYFKLLKAANHNPRITIDRLVVSRESWSFPASECIFAFEKDAATRFLRTREWLQTRKLPRFVFVKVPVELKPFYVDFESSIYIDILSKNIRRTLEAGGDAALVTFSEMMPVHEQTWLPDAEGIRYTSELRMVAVDSRAG